MGQYQMECVCHKCDNRKCVRPDHLFLGTYTDNINDMWKKNRGAKGESNGQSKLTEKEVKKVRKLYKKGIYIQSLLGDMFGISRREIGRIINRQRWAWVK